MPGRPAPAPFGRAKRVGGDQNIGRSRAPAFIGEKQENKSKDVNVRRKWRMKIPVLDLRAEVDLLWEDLNRAVQDVLRSGRFVLGENVRAFEKEVASYLGIKHADRKSTRLNSSHVRNSY